MCTMAFDTDVRLPQAARDMCLKRFKGLKFKIAAVAERFAAQADFVVQFGNSAGISPKGAMSLPLKSYVSVPADVAARIGSGSDESRNFVPAVWNYIQKHKLYRS